MGEMCLCACAVFTSQSPHHVQVAIDFKTNVTIRKVVLVTLLQLKYLSSAVIYLNLLKLINANYAMFQKESFHNCQNFTAIDVSTVNFRCHNNCNIFL